MNAGSGRKTIGRYLLFRPLASGGAATVHLGCLRSDAGFSRAVAIKKLHEHHASDARLTESLLDEARIASRIRHPHVVSVLDVVVEDRQPLVVLEYVEGESLSQLLLLAAASGEPLPIGVAIRIVVDALEGLHAAHEATNDQGVPLLVVHRDVSPQNVMVDVDGHARIFDFGIAKALERSVATTKLGEFRGKLAYASPEQINGRDLDRRTDLWAIGMVLWEAIAGRRLFLDTEPGAMVLAITDGDLPPPSSVRPCPPALDAIVARALERDPDLRYSSAREMALALEKTGLAADHRDVGRVLRRLARVRLEERRQLVSEMEAELRRETESTAIDAVVNMPAPSVAPRRRWPALVAGALAVAAVAAAFYVRRGPSAPPSAPAIAITVASTAPSAVVASAPSVAVATPAPAEPAPSARPSPVGAKKRPKPRPATAAPPSSTAAPVPVVSPGDPLRPDERN